MPIDWKRVAHDVGDLNEDGSERNGGGTETGRRALELLLGEQNIRDAVDYFTTMGPGTFTVEMVLKIIRSYVAMERCYELYKTEPGTSRAGGALFLLAKMGDHRALPWVSEFLESPDEHVQWSGLSLLQTITYGPLGDDHMEQVKYLLGRFADLPNEMIRERASDTRGRLMLDSLWQPFGP